jgi:hypothetical protein
MNKPKFYIQHHLSEKFSNATHRDLTVEYRPGYGWFILEKGQTLMGFHNIRLIEQYMHNVIHRGQLYTPTVKETYG